MSPSGNYRRPDNGHTEEFQSTTVNSLNGETTTDWTLLDTDESATVATDGDIQVEVITQKPSKRPKPTRPSNRQRNSTRGDRRKTTKTTTTTTTTTQTTTTPDCNEELCEYLEAENDQDTVKTATKANKKPSEEDDSEGKLEYSVETVTTATDKKPGSGPTVISPEKAKIVGSKPNSLEKSEEEILADLITTVKPTRRPYKGPSVSIPGLNCSAFTDYYCLQQQLADKPLPPCCFKGIYLTEVCDPEAGKCGKETENLCCLQKLQQSRFRCCHNSSTPNRLANDFSHCCFDHFALETPDDPCCPRSVAQKFWQLKASRVAELCQPNVQFDFSKVVLKSKLESGDPVEVDLGDSRIQAALNYECPYKSTEELYIYYPTDKDGEFDKEIKEIVDQHGDS